jgi:dihydrofolate reductase
MAMDATTYESVLAHANLIEEPGRWRHYYGSVPCWVFTHRHLRVIPGAGLLVHGDVRPVHEQTARAADGQNIWPVGGRELAGWLADAGLLDEILLGIAPVMLGADAPLLPRRLLASDIDRRPARWAVRPSHLLPGPARKQLLICCPLTRRTSSRQMRAGCPGGDLLDSRDEAVPGRDAGIGGDSDGLSRREDRPAGIDDP